MKTTLTNKFLALGFVALAGLGMGVSSVSADDNIHPISREDGSGTRGAFVELFEVFNKVKDKKVDAISKKAEITNSTAVMLTTVSKDENAIGYVSLGSLNKSVKAVQINGVEANAANVKSKKYPVSRPFNVVTLKDNALADDFLGFATSKEAQDIVTKAGYIPTDAKSFKPKNPEGKIVIAGSSSVTPLMEKLKEAYLKQNKKAKIEIQQSDSTTGVNATVEGIADIGMVSRELKESELSKGLKAKVLAIDGLAVIVNPKNALSSLKPEQVKAIFEGKTTKWSEVK
ncbi:phosphate ABC transporter substrate-binding protein [Helicobacter cinaedi PAGU611]|uniref:Phosphate ABC transporter n=1 Tax=Helicobacter cinaedi CCUG 18818 = ATCC BAA-847 TaxID=537971 RepID=A0AAI8MM04_9HELI|nr:substrate-binding domain-containing protein [Helicobacter cinaedi]AWK61277.1 phosphate ABC transporter substrate-binding protein [Helicobacter cinaedi]EFR47168.1 Phosphate-binding protein PstS 2 family protein [Helicobacter cinaedi CCUG 18818 = ATCC BAA-847]QOQ90137.1 substrate-binding domain-containing protein [Helicobacter cinaedi]QOQ96322.1 substrate-binding domain-containing protein [Helicobacter cinaedi]BAM14965.1 phosphate ABC transporter substrate-binding protein [Helicobacter cinaed